MTNFDYVSDYFWRLAQAHDPADILQLELHPGINCSVYRCRYCFGHGQALNPGKFLSADEYEEIAKSLGQRRPTVIISGIATEPLTHPEADALVRVFRGRGFPVGLYTKGHNLTAAVCDALVDGAGECFVTVSLDAGTAIDYEQVHDIAHPPRKGDRVQVSFEGVLENLRRLSALKRKVKPELKLRASILVFEELARDGKLAEAIELLRPDVDLIRIAIAQDRNDGVRVDNLPKDREQLLAKFAAEFEGDGKVAVIASSHTPSRDKAFRQCVAQRTQITIDKSGNVFPCPQVALQPYMHLKLGNVRDTPLSDILDSQTRKRMFELDVDTQMKCRICDRKDEAINSAVASHERAFYGPAR
ncbi:radical SAM protein [Rhizobium leguminosarum]|uniref:radical SAM/SPASM domain-containing protein n=1 Tax=Rhizobium leguminosarum TaxID=384 RepID=UPI001C9399DE|nr:radical SAM protein [Rhizobium leguminosarum]MBY5324382.1 radical SAM protein [Rhizobium leguminosarum]